MLTCISVSLWKMSELRNSELPHSLFREMMLLTVNSGHKDARDYYS